LKLADHSFISGFSPFPFVIFVDSSSRKSTKTNAPGLLMISHLP